MRVPASLTIMAAAVAASPFPFMTIMDISEQTSYSWSVTNWTALCASSDLTTCSYEFSVKGDYEPNAKPKHPNFNAVCGGQGVGSPYRECGLLDNSTTTRRVAAALVPSNVTGNARIQVSIQYTDLDTSTTWWNYTGHADTKFDQPKPLSFTIYPNSVVGVA